jgi:Neuraminidase (sialidase)
LYFSFGGAPLSGSYPNSVAVSKSTDGGSTWATPVAVTFNKNRAFDDKYYIAVDRSVAATAGRIYVSWDRNIANNQILYVAYSADHGATWSSLIKVNDGTSRFERVIGAYPAVDQNTGVVYDSWHDYAKNVIYVDKSTNGAVSWGKDVAAVTIHAGFGTNMGCVGGRAQGPAHAIKVGPSGAIYLVYADPVFGRGFNRGFDILFSKSTNGGQTWSTPISLNDSAFPTTFGIGSVNYSLGCGRRSAPRTEVSFGGEDSVGDDTQGFSRSRPYIESCTTVRCFPRTFGQLQLSMPD